MRFALTADHREFFNKKSYIEFEQMLSSDQIAALRTNADEALAKRLRLPVAKLADKSSAELFQAGYDLWRDNDAIKKVVHKNAFATLASELFQITPIRSGFDQYIITSKGTAAPFAQAFSLQDSCCLSPLAGALILPLDDLMAPLSFFPMPLNAGNGLFISPSLPIPWPELFSTPGLRFIMIGFAIEKTFFRADTRDPHAVNLKLLGYVFNDHLKDSLHPLILRKH
ncbi:MAG: hypothetical protein JSS60_02115 [Verrucomicrobia bacterium]|nr:hypothetical protein [Verrucomicrobiota bacterium]